MAALGLVEPRQSQCLGSFLRDYIASRTDVSSGTATVYGHTQRNLLTFFGEDRDLRSITEGDADRFEIFLDEQGLSHSTKRRRCGLAKQFFESARRSKLITENPFRNTKATVTGNPEKFHFVTQEETQAILEACPDSQWRCIIGLARYGGLRCPSEILALRWEDIDWDKRKICITSSKTKRVGKGSRIMPLFPELRELLQEAFDLAEEGTEYVITRYRHTSVNLRTQLLKIIKRAGLDSWPKLFQNMRSTRETELAEKYPLHVVCAWVGNTAKVAASHYLQVTEEHFEQAAQECVQNEAQSHAVISRIDQESESEGNQEVEALQEVTCKYIPLQYLRLGPAGFEPATNGL
ncbi:tyrosine-type recombinase/integrase [Planctomycetota bacterium]